MPLHDLIANRSEELVDTCTSFLLLPRQRELCFLIDSVAFPSTPRSFICQPPYPIDRQNEIPAHLAAQTPGVIVRARCRAEPVN
jgi:hypothetical protein